MVPRLGKYCFLSVFLKIGSQRHETGANRGTTRRDVFSYVPMYIYIHLGQIRRGIWNFGRVSIIGQSSIACPHLCSTQIPCCSGLCSH